MEACILKDMLTNSCQKESAMYVCRYTVTDNETILLTLLNKFLKYTACIATVYTRKFSWYVCFTLEGVV